MDRPPISRVPLLLCLPYLRETRIKVRYLVSGDAGSVEQHKLTEQIAADKHLASKQAVGKVYRGLRFNKLGTTRSGLIPQQIGQGFLLEAGSHRAFSSMQAKRRYISAG